MIERRNRFIVREETIQSGDEATLTLLSLDDPKMLDA
jgi:hypothetical protein